MALQAHARRWGSVLKLELQPTVGPLASLQEHGQVSRLTPKEADLVQQETDLGEARLIGLDQRPLPGYRAASASPK